MALNSRLPARARAGPQRVKVNGDENTMNKVAQKSIVGATFKPPAKAGAQRAALGELTATSVNTQIPPKVPPKDDVGIQKRARSSTVNGILGPQRIPLGQAKTSQAAVTITTSTSAAAVISRAPVQQSKRPLSLQVTKLKEPIAILADEDNDSMEVEEIVQEPEAMDGVEVTNDDEELDQLASDDEKETVRIARQWPDFSPGTTRQCSMEIDAIKETFHDEVDPFDTTMLSEYAEEIFEYMSKLEVEMMPDPNYIHWQKEITWPMRQMLIDWLLQVHLRYHLLPETLWVAVNIVDRFLSKRHISVQKLQLVGVTAMFIASKYEEILAPSVKEFVVMTERGFSRDDILKGERIVLQTLDFKISSYCSPYSWLRRISKADNYDIHTRTLGKFLVEVTLLDYRFLGVKPSLIAAVGMYSARKMLDGDWNEAFVFYSGFTEEQLIPGHRMIMSKLLEKDFDTQYLSQKYASKKFLKASIFAIDWSRTHGDAEQAGES